MCAIAFGATTARGGEREKTKEEGEEREKEEGGGVQPCFVSLQLKVCRQQLSQGGAVRGGQQRVRPTMWVDHRDMQANVPGLHRGVACGREGTVSQM